MKYKDMVTTLFKFINASKLVSASKYQCNGQNQLLLNATNYLSDMQALEERDPDIWQFFSDGYFSIQINHILRTAKDVGHAGEQGNEKLNI